MAERTSLAWEGVFQRELILAEHRKATILAGLLGFVALFTAVVFTLQRAEFVRITSAPHGLYVIPSLLALASACELWQRAWLGRVLEGGAHRTRAAAYATALVEVSVPTVLMVAVVGLAGAMAGVNAPPLIAYGFFIALSALRLDPWLCVFTGGVAAAEYLGLTAWLAADLSLPPFGGTYLASPAAYAGRGMMLFLLGLATAFVAREIRGRLEHALELQEQRNWVVGVFGRYVTDEVVEVLLNSPDGLRLGGEKRRLTVMMTDLRGFSNLSSHLPPEAVVAMLNHYLEAMTDVIVRFGGTIDEFIGDAILVIFGAPVSRDDHADRAVACALAMQRAMREVNRWNRERGFPEVEMGIGINTGDVVVGNIGSEKRGKFGVVGTEVNLAARIESCTVGGQVLISEATRSALGAPVEIAGEMSVEPKGTRVPLLLHDVVALGPPWDLRRPEPEEEPAPLARPVPVRLRVMEGKQAVGPERAGVLVALSPREGSLADVDSLPPLTELSLHLDGGDEAFVKVVAEEAPGRLRVRFTWRGPATRERLEALLPEPA